MQSWLACFSLSHKQRKEIRFSTVAAVVHAAVSAVLACGAVLCKADRVSSLSPWTWRAKSRKCFTGSPALGAPLCAAGEGFCSFAVRCLPAFLKVVCPSYQAEFVFLTLLACARLKVLFSNRNNRVVRSCVPPFFLYVTGLSFCVSNFTLAENKHFRVDIERTTRRRRREQCRIFDQPTFETRRL